jgi:hypothetical protein
MCFSCVDDVPAVFSFFLCFPICVIGIVCMWQMIKKYENIPINLCGYPEDVHRDIDAVIVHEKKKLLIMCC